MKNWVRPELNELNLGETSCISFGGFTFHNGCGEKNPYNPCKPATPIVPAIPVVDHDDRCSDDNINSISCL